MLTVNIYKILLSEKYEVKDTEQNSVIGDRIKDLPAYALDGRSIIL